MAAKKTRKKKAADATGGGYRIGTVSNLTGLDPNTIRAWERRYGAIEPDRNNVGAGFYTPAEVLLQLGMPRRNRFSP